MRSLRWMRPDLLHMEVVQGKVWPLGGTVALWLGCSYGPAHLKYQQVLR